MAVTEFRNELRRRLAENACRTLLRIVLSESLVLELTGDEIVRQAPQLAEKLTRSKPGDVVLILLPHSVELFLLQLGLVLTGRIPAILPWPTARIDPEKYQRNLSHQLRSLPAGEMITLPRLAQNLSSALPYAVSACPIALASRWEELFKSPGLEGSPSGDVNLPAYSVPTDALFLQFSGGTTGAQKAVVVTAAMLAFQLESLASSLAFRAQDSVVSWLPLYHDMGLIACLWLPLWRGAPSLHLSASEWLLNPELLFDFADRYRGTFCWLPNFAFSFMAGQRQRIQRTYSLDHVRAWINCSEPVRFCSCAAFAQQYAHCGVVPESIQASYAMAENVFAVTQSTLGKVPSRLSRASVTRGAGYPPLAFDLVEDVYVSSGRVLSGMRVRIVNSEGAPCEERTAGEIQIRTECMFSGYWAQREASTAPFTSDGWYSTGDYGFFSQGELFVIGRLKDIIIVGGQNIFPEDVEAVVNTVPGVYPGRVVAFGLLNEAHGTEGLAIVAEARHDSGDLGSVQHEIFQVVLSAIGIAPRAVSVVPERWIVKSTAGKISRRETRERFEREVLRLPQQ